MWYGLTRPARQPNVLLIVVDTLRADCMGCLGSTKGLTPRMDALAATGVCYTHAYSHSSWTLPSVASLLTSTYPTTHGAQTRRGKLWKIHGSVTTLAECLSGSAYRAGAVVNVEWLSAAFGMDRGYEHLDAVSDLDNVLYRRATRTTDAALSWLDRIEPDRFHLMVHYFDPHMVYNPPAPYRKRFALPQDKETKGWIWGSGTQARVIHSGNAEEETSRYALAGFDPNFVPRLRALYEAEVAYTDHEIGRLLDGLRSRGLDASTLVVLTSDHGEEFMDHGSVTHGHTLYDELIHVPLILSLPGRLPSGRRVESVVRHVDVAPTICELARVERSSTFVGSSLLSTISGQDDDDRVLFAEKHGYGPHRFCLRSGGHKLVIRQASKRFEMYDVVNDPAESTDLSSRKPPEMLPMAREFRRILDESRRPDEADAPATPSSDQQERLRSLGYTP